MAPEHLTEALSRLLREVESLALSDRGAHVAEIRIEVVDTGEREVTVRANYAGMIHLASQLLRLAVARTPGAHAHIDECGVADHCDRDLVLVFE